MKLHFFKEFSHFPHCLFLPPSQTYFSLFFFHFLLGYFFFSLSLFLFFFFLLLFLLFLLTFLLFCCYFFFFFSLLLFLCFFFLALFPLLFLLFFQNFFLVHLFFFLIYIFIVFSCLFSCCFACPFPSLSFYCFFFFFMCWELQFEERNGFGERLYLLQEVGNFGLKEDHNATWRSVWNNKKSCYKNATNVGSFSIEFVCLK